MQGLTGEEAEPALQAMLERLYDDATDFAFPERRFELVYADVEKTLYETSQPAAFVVAVRGLEMGVERVDLGEAMWLEEGVFNVDDLLGGAAEAAALAAKSAG